MDRLIIIAGPTAVGKSAAAVELAVRQNGSIISAGSMQVYRGMDIGTATIQPSEMHGIPHYLIDIADPAEEWNVVRFQKEAQAAVREITSLGRLPILVGGTGFYIQSLLYDIDFTETSENAAYRRELSDIAREQGPQALHRLLEEADPRAAADIHPNNVKRVIRALEYVHDTGECISGHNEEQRRRPPAYDSVFFCLTMDRAALYQRIDRRVDRMVEEGLIDEVRMLKERGLGAQNTSMQGLGYRQILAYLDGEDTLEEAVRQIKLQTRHYAKRQLTWFKREKDVRWLDVQRYDSPQKLADEMEQVIRSHYTG